MRNSFARRRSTLLAAALAISAGAFTLSACSDDDGPSGTGAVSIAVAPTSLTITPGSTGSATYTITRTAPFTGAVTLTSTGEPVGMDLALTPQVVDAGTTNGTVDIAITPEATPGTYPIVISAAGSGITTKTTTLTVVIAETPAARR